MFYNVKSGKFLIQHFSSNMHLFNLEATSEEDAYLGFIQLQSVPVDNLPAPNPNPLYS